MLDDEIPVRMTVRVPKARPDFDVRVTAQVPSYDILETADGKTGRPISLRVDIPIEEVGDQC